MARPQKNKVDYFPHPVTHGKKMSYMEKKYGNDGYAVWFKILEELGNTDYHYLNLSDEVQIMFLSDRCMVSEETLLNIILDLVKLREFDKILWDESRILFSEKFIGSIQDAYIKRSNSCIDKKQLLQLLIGLGVLKPVKSSHKPIKSNSEGVEKPQTKLEETKEEETKVLYMPSDFLKDWNEIRKEVTGKPSFVNRLQQIEKDQFNEISEAYTREQFRNAIKGLFKQDKFPKGVTAMNSSPKHFLNYFELYLTAHGDKNKNVWGNED